MPARRIGKLDMTDIVQVLFDGRRQITFHDLHVIDVVFDCQIRVIGARDNIERLIRGVNQVARPVTGIDRFYQFPKRIIGAPNRAVRLT